MCRISCTGTWFVQVSKCRAAISVLLRAWTASDTLSRGRYHGGRRLSSDDSFHSPTVIPPSALDKPSIIKRYQRRRTCSHTSPRRSLAMETLDDTRFVECRWWNDGWTVKTVAILTVVGLHDTGSRPCRSAHKPMPV